MITLDTDHLSVLQHRDNPRALAVRERLGQVPLTTNVATTVISFEEQTRGWLRMISRFMVARSRFTTTSDLSG